MVDLVEIVREDGRYRLKEIYVNPSWIISISEEPASKQIMEEAQSIGLAPQARYSRITVSSGYGPPKDIVVVGDPSFLNRRLSTKRVLKG